MNLALDTNVLILLAGGLVDPKLIGAHKRLKKLNHEDFELLLEYVRSYRQIVVTPHVLAETSNLIGQDDDQLSQRLRLKLGELIATQEERHTAAIKIVQHDVYPRLGVADCGLLSILDDRTELLTTDVATYLAALNVGLKAKNFNHDRPSAWR